jgi:hypothetical protein
MKLAVIGAVLAVILVGASGYMAFVHKPQPVSASCVAGDNELCPSDEWLRTYREAKALEKEINDDSANQRLQQKRDLLAGMGQRLGQNQPAGYQWSEQRQKFTRVMPQPTVSPAK